MTRLLLLRGEILDGRIGLGRYVDDMVVAHMGSKP